MLIRQCSVSAMDNNVYLLTCRHTGEQLLVDAADNIDRIDAMIARSNAPVSAIVTTHRHWDHHRALASAVQHTEATTYAGDADADEMPVPIDVRLTHGDIITVGELAITVLGLRGHTQGSVALAVPGGDPEATTVLLTGDSLFPGGPGKTESPADFASLMDDLESRVFGTYADSTVVLPGHGDGTTVGAERGNLQDWRRRGW